MLDQWNLLFAYKKPPTITIANRFIDLELSRKSHKPIPINLSAWVKYSMIHFLFEQKCREKICIGVFPSSNAIANRLLASCSVIAFCAIRSHDSTSNVLRATVLWKIYSTRQKYRSWNVQISREIFPRLLVSQWKRWSSISTDFINKCFTCNLLYFRWLIAYIIYIYVCISILLYVIVPES